MTSESVANAVATITAKKTKAPNSPAVIAPLSTSWPPTHNMIDIAENNKKMTMAIRKARCFTLPFAMVNAFSTCALKRFCSFSS